MYNYTVWSVIVRNTVLPFLPRTFPPVDLPLTSDPQVRKHLRQKMTGGHKDKTVNTRRQKYMYTTFLLAPNGLFGVGSQCYFIETSALTCYWQALLK